MKELYLSLCGPVAQLGARFHGMEEVIGSIPIRSTIHFDVSGSNVERVPAGREGHRFDPDQVHQTVLSTLEF
jgi:hypothetical protein